MTTRLRPAAAALAALALVSACSSASPSASSGASSGVSSSSTPASAPTSLAPGAAAPAVAAAAIPAPLDPNDLYAADRPGMLSPEARAAKSLVYVPNSEAGTVSVVDPATYKVLRTVKTGKLPQHVTPAYDEKTLWVDNDEGNSLTPIDPRTGAFGAPVPVDDPYNLYFTADGRHAVVVAEALKRLDFRDPTTMRLQKDRKSVV